MISWRISWRNFGGVPGGTLPQLFMKSSLYQRPFCFALRKVPEPIENSSLVGVKNDPYAQGGLYTRWWNAEIRDV